MDDSSGSFGQFAAELVCRWIRARQGSRRRSTTDDHQTPVLGGRRSLWVCSGIEEYAVEGVRPRPAWPPSRARSRSRFESAAQAGQSAEDGAGHCVPCTANKVTSRRTSASRNKAGSPWRTARPWPAIQLARSAEGGCGLAGAGNRPQHPGSARIWPSMSWQDSARNAGAPWP